MQEILSQLIDLQVMDTRIAEIEAVIKNTPLQIKTLNDKLEKTAKGQEFISAEMSENKKAYNSLEKELLEKKELLGSSQKKLTSVQNNKEYESVLRELDTLKKNIAEGDAKLKDMTSLNFKYESEFATINELNASIESQLHEMSHNKTDEDKELRQELEDLTKKREDYVASIKKSTVSKYERVRQHRNNLAIVAASEEICTGCYMRIPPQLFVDVKKDKAVYNCPHCQRILYYRKPEENA